jgi:hypothetical protein
MSFRVKASAIAVSAAVCMLLAPAAMASAGVSHAPVQVTGKKLKELYSKPHVSEKKKSPRVASNASR